MLSEYLDHCEDAGTRAESGSARTSGKRIIEPVEASSRDHDLPSPQRLERCIQLGSQILAAGDAAKPDDLPPDR